MSTCHGSVGKDQKAPDVKWTSGKPLTQAEVLDVVKPYPHYSGYVNTLPWGSYNSDSASQSQSPSEDVTVSAMNTAAQDVPELDKQDYPHHFHHPPLQQYFGQDHKDYVDHVPSNDYVPTPPLMILAVAQVVETLLTSPVVPHVLLATPLGANECSLCEKSIVYYHMDHRTGVNEQYCSSCHQVWPELNWEMNYTDQWQC